MNHLLFKALGDEAFSFKFEDSDLLTGLIAGETRVCLEMFNDNVKMLMMIMMVLKESHPDKYTEHCWNVENRGAVGETTFHVCFLMGTPTHMYCAKR